MKYSTAAIVVADCGHIETDATYLAHAANAYPKLVQRTKQRVSECHCRGGTTRIRGGGAPRGGTLVECGACADDRALLREFGEAS